MRNCFKIHFNLWRSMQNLGIDFGLIFGYSQKNNQLSETFQIYFDNPFSRYLLELPRIRMPLAVLQQPEFLEIPFPATRQVSRLLMDHSMVVERIRKCVHQMTTQFADP